MSHIKDLMADFYGENTNRSYCPNCQRELAAKYSSCADRNCDKMYCNCNRIVDYLYCRNCGKKESELWETETTKNITSVTT